MRTKDLKSLSETISTVVQPIDDRSKLLAEGYLNSLTEKARQVYSSVNEEKDEDEGEKEESPAEEKAEDKAEMIMKRLAAKALKRARRKAATNEEVELAEMAAPGYEDWASDPKVKASFKKQYGKDWKQVMYGRSWNMAKMDEEVDLAEGGDSAKRMRILRKGKPVKGAVKDFMDRSFKKKFYKNKEKFGGETPAVLGRARLKHAAMKAKGLAEAEQLDEEVELAEGVSAKRMRILRKGKPVKGAVADFMDRSFKKKFYKNKEKFGGETPAVLGRARLKHSAMKAKGLAEAEQLDELSDNTLFSARWKAHQKGRTRLTGKIDNELIKRKLLAPPTTSMRERENQYVAHRDANRARLKQQGMHEEAEQLDEAGYKRLMRLKRAAYKADLASRSSVLDPTDARSQGKKSTRLKRAAAEREDQVAASMARRGGASDDAVRGGGSRIGKSGKYTKKAGTLANQRAKALSNFRLAADRGVARDTGVGSVKAMADRLQKKKPQMTPDQVAKKREDQAAMRDFRNRARSGDFGQNNQEGMRPRYNYLKRTGKLKTK